MDIGFYIGTLLWALLHFYVPSDRGPYELDSLRYLVQSKVPSMGPKPLLSCLCLVGRMGRCLLHCIWWVCELRLSLELG